eukprot:CAMPEP_0172527512 /NCGR_PEP_ID=MMETSP1067-20121228/2182_1 /TAXON_ID=265564 ORGANISM="Thalassiosira punctigera, Strain Tpunct2005C2" /NCGR_SAMPLE_ID=MMETSP1067 /ASSEMBLY_ACC=CAM_ASM_000444 /LENGTH=30 /DNA_ID= /DNA_START= /DNA_END= /DNA_ORIENTATION=
MRKSSGLSFVIFSLISVDLNLGSNRTVSMP